MSLFERFKNLFRPPEPSQFAVDPIAFIYVKIPGEIAPLDREAKFEAPLEVRLAGTGVGSVSGGGSQLGDLRSDGSRPIEFCGVDIDATNVEKALELLRSELPAIGAPDGTELHYTLDGARLQDVYAQSEWTLRQPRTSLHPGFGI